MIELPTVALAVAVGPRGVLVVDRRDLTPPVAFPGGKVETGETPAEAAARETLEETGQRIRVLREIGRRRHPITGRWLVYLAAELTEPTAPLVPALSEVLTARWVPVDQAAAVFGSSLYVQVRAYLARELDEPS